MIINFYAHNDGFKEELIYIINSSTIPDKGDVIKINNRDYIVNKIEFNINRQKIYLIKIHLSKKHDLFSNNSKTII